MLLIKTFFRPDFSFSPDNDLSKIEEQVMKANDDLCDDYEIVNKIFKIF